MLKVLNREERENARVLSSNGAHASSQERPGRFYKRDRHILDIYLQTQIPVTITKNGASLW